MRKRISIFAVLFLLIAVSASAQWLMQASSRKGGAVPTTPVITATPGNAKNVIALSSGDTGKLTADIHWGTTSGIRTNVIVNPTLPYTHTGLTNGTTYYYSLVGCDLDGCNESAEVSGTPAIVPVINAKNPTGTTPDNSGGGVVGTIQNAANMSCSVGDILIAIVTFGTNIGDPGTVTFSDTLGNSWTTDATAPFYDTSGNFPAYMRVSIGSCTVVNGKSGLTKVTASCGQAGIANLYVLDATGITATTPTSHSATGGGSSVQTLNSGALNPSGACLYIGVGMANWNGGTTVTYSLTWSGATETGYNNSTSYSLAEFSYLVGSGSKTYTCTLTNAGQTDYWIAVVAAYHQ